jgi:hypothetical protein
MAVKRVSVNWTTKLNESKDLPRYGDSSDSQINPKYPGDGEAEGHAVIQKGKRFLVGEFQKKTVIPKPT